MTNVQFFLIREQVITRVTFFLPEISIKRYQFENLRWHLLGTGIAFPKSLWFKNFNLPFWFLASVKYYENFPQKSPLKPATIPVEDQQLKLLFLVFMKEAVEHRYLYKNKLRSVDIFTSCGSLRKQMLYDKVQGKVRFSSLLYIDIIQVFTTKGNNSFKILDLRKQVQEKDYSNQIN